MSSREPKTKEVCHDLTFIRKVRREALKHQAYEDRDYSNGTRKAKNPAGFITGKTLFQVYLKANKKPMYYVLKRRNQRKRGKKA